MTIYMRLPWVDGKDRVSVVNGLIRQVQQLPAQVMASLTWDRGSALAQHKRLLW